jgi:hypothetical protein
MAKEISKILKIIFLIHFILGIIIGVIFLFIPEIYCDIVGFTVTDKGPFRLIGAASLALGGSSFLGYRSSDWEKVKILVQMELIWLISATGAMFFWLIFEGGPIAGWVIVGMFIGFLIAFLYAYIYEEK